jgi:hypothetical protein
MDCLAAKVLVSDVRWFEHGFDQNFRFSAVLDGSSVREIRDQSRVRFLQVRSLRPTKNFSLERAIA